MFLILNRLRGWELQEVAYGIVQDVVLVAIILIMIGV